MKILTTRSASRPAPASSIAATAGILFVAIVLLGIVAKCLLEIDSLRNFQVNYRLPVSNTHVLQLAHANAYSTYLDEGGEKISSANELQKLDVYLSSRAWVLKQPGLKVSGKLVVEKGKMHVDGFGNRFRLVEDTFGESILSIVSDGPDQLPGTEDDLCFYFGPARENQGNAVK